MYLMLDAKKKKSIIRQHKDAKMIYKHFHDKVSKNHILEHEFVI